MKRKKHIIPDWRKPRFNRSRPNTIKANVKDMKAHATLISKDLTTKWSLMSQATFDQMVEKGALTLEQIESYHRYRVEVYKGKDTKSAPAQIKKHTKSALAARIATFDFDTPEGLERLKQLMKEEPLAESSFGEAIRLKEIHG